MVRKVFLRRHIMLRKEFAKLVLDGIKNVTIRLGVVIPKYDEVIIHSGGRPIAKARIVDVKYKKVSELTDEDARLDGLNNVNELINMLRKLYGEIRVDDVVTIIRFKVIQRFNDLSSDDVYYGLNPSDIARIGLKYLRDELSDEELKILESLAEGLSIREVARRFYGSPLNRVKVRKTLRKVLRELIKRKIITTRPPSKDLKD